MSRHVWLWLADRGNELGRVANNFTAWCLANYKKRKDKTDGT